MTDQPVAVVDLDGVLADVRHRLHYVRGDGRRNWDAFFAGIPDDDVLAEGRAVVERLAGDHEIIYVTGRPERTRAATGDWLARHRLPAGRVVMRPDGDRRPAGQLKPRLLRSLAREGRRIAVVVDDDEAVCDALEHAGWPVLRADWMPVAGELHAVQEQRDSRT